MVTGKPATGGGVTTVTTETTENEQGIFQEKINDHKDGMNVKEKVMKVVVTVVTVVTVLL